VSTLYFGKLSDRVGRKRTFLIGYIFLAIWSVPMWLLVDTGNVAMFYLAVIVVGFLLGPTYGPMCALFAEMFPVKVRCPEYPSVTPSARLSAALSLRCSQKFSTPPTTPRWPLPPTAWSSLLSR